MVSAHCRTACACPEAVTRLGTGWMATRVVHATSPHVSGSVRLPKVTWPMPPTPPSAAIRWPTASGGPLSWTLVEEGPRPSTGILMLLPCFVADGSTTTTSRHSTPVPLPAAGCALERAGSDCPRGRRRGGRRASHTGRAACSCSVSRSNGPGTPARTGSSPTLHLPAADRLRLRRAGPVLMLISAPVAGLRRAHPLRRAGLVPADQVRG